MTPIIIMVAALKSAGRAYGKLASHESALNMLGNVVTGSASQLPITEKLSVCLLIPTVLSEDLTWPTHARNHKTGRKKEKCT